VAAQKHILVADDEITTSRLLSRVFEQAGFRVSTAFDGRLALEKMRRDPPDLVCVDLLMPGADGYAILKAVKADARLAHIPVVVITATSPHTRTEDVLALGAARCLLKPFTRSTILNLISELLT
jgi:CheY-like chemotaxis protein